MNKGKKLPQQFNKEKFASLLNKAKGSRTQAHFAEDAELSSSYLNKYMNQKYKNPPTPATLQRIAGIALNGVTYSDLLDAAGYETSEHIVNYPHLNDLSPMHLKKTCLSIVMENLVNLNFQWTFDNSELHGEDYVAHFLLKTDTIKYWDFLICPYSGREQDSNDKYGFCLNLMSYYKKIHKTKDNSKKLSLVTNDVSVYEITKETFIAPSNVLVSVILLDCYKREFIEETYLSDTTGFNKHKLNALMFGKNTKLK